MASLMERLFGGGNAGNAGNATTAVADATGATASSPFLQYLQQNQGAAKQAAQAFMGPRPERDNTMALMQMGLGILGAPTGGPPLQAIAQGAQTAMPYFMAEREKQKEYDAGVQQLATQLGMKDFEFMQKAREAPDLQFDGDYLWDPQTFRKERAAGKDPKAAFMSSVVMEDKGATVDNSNALADMEVALEEMKANPNVDPREIERQQSRIRNMKWQIKREESQPGTVNMTYQNDDGKWVSLMAPVDKLSETMGAITDKNEADEIQAKQEATANLVSSASRALDIIDSMGDRAAASAGGLGKLAGTVAAWSDVLGAKLSGPRRQQYQEAIENPKKKLDELMSNPETENFIRPSVYEKLSKMSQENAQLVSVLYGMAYATQKASDEGGRVSDRDFAIALDRYGANLDSWVQDPATLRKGILETVGGTVRDYATKLQLKENGGEIMEKDYLFRPNGFLEEQGFVYENGQLKLKGEDIAPRDQQQGQGTQPPGAPVPNLNIQGMGLDQLQQLDASQMTPEQLKQASDRYNQLTQGAQ